MRLKSSIWVAAYLRRCQTEGIFGAVRRRGAEEAGSVFVKVALLDGNAMLYAPAPQTVYDDSRPIERMFAATSPQPVPEASVEERLGKEVRVDPAVWIDATGERAGRLFRGLARGKFAEPCEPLRGTKPSPGDGAAGRAGAVAARARCCSSSYSPGRYLARVAARAEP